MVKKRVTDFAVSEKAIAIQRRSRRFASNQRRKGNRGEVTATLTNGSAERRLLRVKFHLTLDIFLSGLKYERLWKNSFFAAAREEAIWLEGAIMGKDRIMEKMSGK